MRTLTILFLVSVFQPSTVHALTKEEVKAIEESNARAYRELTSESNAKQLNNVDPADREDGKETAHQKTLLKREKQDAKLYPELLSASNYISNPQAHEGKIFKAKIRGRGVIAFSPDRDSFSQGSVIPDCNFSYVNTDADYGKVAGNGHYKFVGGFYGCNMIEDISEHPSNTQEILVKFMGIVKGVNKLGQQLTLPKFKIVGFEHENQWFDTRGGKFNSKDTI